MLLKNRKVVEDNKKVSSIGEDIGFGEITLTGHWKCFRLRFESSSSVFLASSCKDNIWVKIGNVLMVTVRR